jgi:cytochrome c peroxidase
MRLRLTPALVAALSLASCGAPGDRANVPPAADDARATPAELFTPAEVRAILSLSPLPPLPPDPTNHVADDPDAARFGQWIFFDSRFSGSGTVSCASCHNPATNWADAHPVPSTFSPDLRHVPSLWNVAYNRWQFWDGRADSLWAQALEPLENPLEHAGTREQYARLVREDPDLRLAYQRVFGAPPGTAADATDSAFVNIGKALAAYQRRLVSRRAPFDVFVEGLRDNDSARLAAISPAAQRGLKLFVGRANCFSCHHGPTFTDSEFHDTGIAAFDPKNRRDPGRFGGVSLLLTSPFNALGPFTDDPAGRSHHPTSFLINRTEWRGQFKTPTLRNVALTPPYMHRGQLATLEDVVAFYSTLRPRGVDLAAVASARARDERAQIRFSRPDGAPAHTHAAGERVLAPLDLTPEESADLVEFLRTLSDVAIDPALTRPPSSPG